MAPDRPRGTRSRPGPLHGRRPRPGDQRGPHPGGEPAPGRPRRERTAGRAPAPGHGRHPGRHRSARAGPRVRRPADPWLWLLQQPATFLIESLRKGITNAAEEGLAGLLARGEAGGRLAPAGLPTHALLPAQDLTYRACRGTGLWLVWGPPGTGKTSVLKRAISDLIADDKRVLLVSATNIAVDNALLGVVRENRHTPGQLVRVGPPHLRDIADDPQVCLSLIVRAKLSAVDDRRQAVAAELASVNRRTEKLPSSKLSWPALTPTATPAAPPRLSDPPHALHVSPKAVAEHGTDGEPSDRRRQFACRARDVTAHADLWPPCGFAIGTKDSSAHPPGG
ncbi:AAA domain-containing protein [Kitasatospora herbaricolor]|uniref:AAA domain-containing protein n=1 Tax=Kitasatospora herbaricolor TaxID=68217 RepID=UPI0036DD483C